MLLSSTSMLSISISMLTFALMGEEYDLKCQSLYLHLLWLGMYIFAGKKQSTFGELTFRNGFFCVFFKFFIARKAMASLGFAIIDDVNTNFELCSEDKLKSR